MQTSITNHRPRLLALHWPKSADGLAGKIRLVPGKNEVPAEHVRSAEKNAQFLQWKRLGWITVSAPVDKAAPAARTPATEAEPQDIKKLGAKAAIALIAETSDAKTLEAWLGTEERATVVKVLTERIQTVSGDTDEDGHELGGDESDKEDGDSDQE